MKVLFSRHGNTFQQGEPVTWIGAHNDLPLVQSGINQAKILAHALKSADLSLSAIYCGPLKRTHQYAQIIIDELQLSLHPIIDEQLNELDYGDWAGLTNEEIIQKFGPDVLNNWEQYTQWPIHCHWGKSESIIYDEVFSFLNRMIHQNLHYPILEADQEFTLKKTILVISSNGRLRYFLNLISHHLKETHLQRNTKVHTGNICSFTYFNNTWSLNYWNEKPSLSILRSS